jgi:glycosyltransferase involved in cell wall biosynthesis
MWRIGWPEALINMSGIGDSTSLNKMIFDKTWFMDVKTVKLQRQASSHQKRYIEWLKSIQSECGFKLMYEVDDVVFREEIPDYNIFKEGFDTDEIRQNCIDMINMVDEVTVTCKYMRDLYIEKTGKKEITVVPNFPPYSWLGYQYNYQKNINDYDKNKKKPRIVYAGSGAHFDVGNKTGQNDDFTHVNKFISDNINKYQFIFIGAVPPPLQEYVNSRKIEFHPWKSLIEYPNFLASLNAQLFIAPLQDNRFNRSKSDIKYIESACLGIPCLCQDMVTYENALPELKFKTADELASQTEQLLNWKNRSKYYKLVPQLREIGSERFLEHPSNINSFVEALNTSYGDPSRQFLKRWN